MSVFIPSPLTVAADFCLCQYFCLLTSCEPGQAIFKKLYGRASGVVNVFHCHMKQNMNVTPQCITLISNNEIDERVVSVYVCLSVCVFVCVWFHFNLDKMQRPKILFPSQFFFVESTFCKINICFQIFTKFHTGRFVCYSDPLKVYNPVFLTFIGKNTHLFL
jgi:hypothetical protein